MSTVNFRGYVYEIEHKPELSNSDYTQHKVFHIKTKNKDYSKAHKAIEVLMADGSWRKGIWQTKPYNMENYLHPYHTFTYDRELDCYVYTLVTPYDD